MTAQVLTTKHGMASRINFNLFSITRDDEVILVFTIIFYPAAIKRPKLFLLIIKQSLHVFKINSFIQLDCDVGSAVVKISVFKPQSSS